MSSRSDVNPQLTTENYATAVSVVSQVIVRSANDTSEQTSAALTAVTDYLLDLSMFIETSDVQINETVNYIHDSNSATTIIMHVPVHIKFTGDR